MKSRYLSFIVAICVLMFSTLAFAFDPPKPNGYVMDLAEKLNSEQLSKLNSKLDNLNKTTKNEFAGLIIPSLNGESIEDVANQTFKSWGVGKRGLDNGVLVVIAIAERKSRIETGKGVEGDLTDLQANDILHKTLAPYLKRGDFYGGLNATFDSVSSAIESRHNAVVAPTPSSQNSSPPLFLLFFIGGAGIIILGIVIKTIAESHDEKKARERRLKAEEQIKQMKFEFGASQPKPAPVNKDPYRSIDEKIKRIAEQDRKIQEMMDSIPKPSSRSGVAINYPVYEKPHSRRTPENRSAKPIYYVQSPTNRGDEESRRREEQARRRQDEEDRARRRREEDRRRQDEEDDRRRRNSYSSSYSSSSYDSGSSSSFGGFGGGDCGGGGSSGDW